MTHRNAKNPQDFQPGDVIKSVYTGERWKIVEIPRGGVGKMLSLENGRLQSWNFESNKHFVLEETATKASTIGAQTEMEL